MRKNYDFPEKEIYHDLERQFLEKLGRTKVQGTERRRKDQKVVLMPSEQCLDLECVVKDHHFSPENVYCIEADKSIFSRMKDRATELGFADAHFYQGRVSDFFREQMDVVFDAVLLDYQGPFIEEHQHTLHDLFYHRQLSTGGILAINVLARRDGQLKEDYAMPLAQWESIFDLGEGLDFQNLSLHQFTRDTEKTLPFHQRLMENHILDERKWRSGAKTSVEEKRDQVVGRELKEIRDPGITLDILTHAFYSNEAPLRAYLQELKQQRTTVLTHFIYHYLRWIPEPLLMKVFRGISPLLAYPLRRVEDSQLLSFANQVNKEIEKVSGDMVKGYLVESSYIPAYGPIDMHRGSYLSSGGKSTMYFDFIKFERPAFGTFHTESETKNFLADYCSFYFTWAAVLNQPPERYQIDVTKRNKLDPTVKDNYSERRRINFRTILNPQRRKKVPTYKG
ncbi:class I SAM-dependent methyltransferase [Candidatus Woesearchaeota archaeon]|nr:class I SAM-dependent methyltransferase [Candidatus Woesearchaeota archaeon]